MRTLRIPTAEAFIPLLQPARYKGAHGGRGSGKSHFFADQGVESALAYPGDHGEGLRWLCVRENQKSLKESAKFLIESKLQQFGLGEKDGFKVLSDVIQTPKDGLIVFTGMKDHTADSIKSYEGFHRAWLEEAQSISQRSLDLLRPTIRAEGSEIWASWNPRFATDPIERLLRSDLTPTGSQVVHASWRQNPWFPRVLEQERQDCLANEPEKYGHIWEGEYATVLEGAYYAKALNESRLSSRIGHFVADDLIGLYAFWDLGGTSGKSDATAIWIVQFVADQIRVLDYYEAQGQPFVAHFNWLKSRGWDRAHNVLPHDGRKHDIVHKITPAGFLRDAGLTYEVVESQGAGAALLRIDATRRIFHRFHFHENATEAGRQALGWYHAKIDEKRRFDLGPEHDWSSHAADAFGLIAIFDAKRGHREGNWKKPLRRNLKGVL